MSIKIVVPPLGESVVEATVGRWLKTEGERVSAGETLVELETDKVNLEVGAERDGVLTRIEHKAGDDVKIGDVLGVIEESVVEPPPSSPTPRSGAREARVGDMPSTSAQNAEQAISQGREQPAPQPSPISQRKEAGSPPLSRILSEAERSRRTTGEELGVGAQRERATPVAIRLAEEHGVDLAHVAASGTDGRVTKQDVESYLASQKSQLPAPNLQLPITNYQTPPPPQPSPAKGAGEGARREERVRMSRRRRTIAQRLVEAQHTAAMLTTFNEIDMSAVMDIRNRRKESFKAKHGVGLGFMSFFVKAAIGALKAFPQLNAEIQGDEIVLKHYYDIGMAVGAEEGLVVPVLRDADRMSFAEIERTIEAFVQKVKDNTLSIEDLRGGTFTLTNGGLHKIEPRPVVANGEVVVRPMMYVALSYDHRIVDGREAVQFLVRVKQLVEDPEVLLLEG